MCNDSCLINFWERSKKFVCPYKWLDMQQMTCNVHILARRSANTKQTHRRVFAQYYANARPGRNSCTAIPAGYQTVVQNWTVERYWNRLSAGTGTILQSIAVLLGNGGDDILPSCFQRLFNLFLFWDAWKSTSVTHQRYSKLGLASRLSLPLLALIWHFSG